MADAVDISKLSDADLLAPAALPTLEAYINHQAATPWLHNAKAGRSLLKLYQMHPTKVNVEAVIKILTKALFSCPDSDFQLAAYLLPATLRDAEAVATLKTLDAELNTGRYEDFWATVKSSTANAVTGSVVGFDDAARDAILRCLNKVYTKIDTALLTTYLNTSDLSICTKAGWTVDGAVAVAPVVPDNTPRPKKPVDDGLKYADISGLVQSLSR